MWVKLWGNDTRSGITAIAVVVGVQMSFTEHDGLVRVVVSNSYNAIVMAV